MYKLTIDSPSVIRQEDGVVIPLAEGNTDFAVYEKWEAEGNAPDPAQSPKEVSTEKSNRDRETKDKQDIIEAKDYAKLKALAAMSPSQVHTWVVANVTNIPQAQDAIATLAIAVSVLVRRL